MLISIIQSAVGANFSYVKGDVVDAPDNIANGFIAHRIGVAITKKEVGSAEIKVYPVAVEIAVEEPVSEVTEVTTEESGEAEETAPIETTETTAPEATEVE